MIESSCPVESRLSLFFFLHHLTKYIFVVVYAETNLSFRFNVHLYDTFCFHQLIIFSLVNFPLKVLMTNGRAKIDL